MRIPLFLATLFLLTGTALAQAPAGMSQADMQKMMQGMQAMQSCMAKVDMEAMERLGQEGEKVQAEVESLCKGGKRDAAQQRAMDFGMRAMQDPNMKIMQQCGQQMQGMMPPMPYTNMEEQKNRHVCDGM